MGGLSGTLTRLTQLHVPELEHLYKVGIGTPHRLTGHRLWSCLRAASRLGADLALTSRDSPQVVTSDLALELTEAQLVQSQETMSFRGLECQIARHDPW